MSISIPALVNPKLLIWAREQAGYTLEIVAESLKLPIEKIRAWENGEKSPSARQAENLAKAYHCSFSIFSLLKPPQIAPLATEYRHLPGVQPGKETPELRFALRDMLYRRHIALNLMEELDEPRKSISLITRLHEDPESVAIHIREILNVSSDTQFSWISDSQSWKAWRNAVESTGVLVLLFNDVELEEVRGVSIFHSKLPIIGINNKERSSRTFTLLHELVHILLKHGMDEQSAIDEKRSDKEWNKVERFAEKVAGAVLMPASTLRNEQLIQIRRPTDSWSTQEVQRIAKKYKVTPLAFATRLLSLGLMSPAIYRNWKDEWNDFLAQHPPKEGGGFVTHAEKALNRNGTTFTTLVLEALTLDRITPVDASRYLKVGYPHIEDLRMFFAYGRPLTFHHSETE
jgi:Zn-dependent peptidase ImmA (M78 family)/transcriptional regulator with XRE-family HTH domain